MDRNEIIDNINKFIEYTKPCIISCESAVNISMPQDDLGDLILALVSAREYVKAIDERIQELENENKEPPLIVKGSLSAKSGVPDWYAYDPYKFTEDTTRLEEYIKKTEGQLRSMRAKRFKDSGIEELLE